MAKKKTADKVIPAIEAIERGEDPMNPLPYGPLRNEPAERLATIYTSTSFTEALMRRSERAGAIIDKVLDSLELVIDKHASERRKKKDLLDKDAQVRDATMLKAAKMLLDFHQNTQITATRQLTHTVDLQSMSDEQLRALANGG